MRLHMKSTTNLDTICLTNSWAHSHSCDTEVAHDASGCNQNEQFIDLERCVCARYLYSAHW